VGWNALFLIDIFRSNRFPPLPGRFALLAVGLAFALSLGALRIPLIQHLLLKPNRQMGELRPFLRLLIFVSGLMIVILSILLFTGLLDRFPEFEFPKMRR
jgi:hypothetical protein